MIEEGSPRMSFDLPADLERELELYALRERISLTDALTKLVKRGLKSSKRKVDVEVTDSDLETLRRNVPIFAFMQNLPEEVVQGMETASKQIRAERFNPRG